MTDVLELEASTGEAVERDFTADEQAQRQADALAAQAAAQAAADKADADAAATAAAIGHAKSLGFTDAMIAVMYPALTP